jgi:hypothetical protein
LIATAASSAAIFLNPIASYADIQGVVTIPLGQSFKLENLTRIQGISSNMAMDERYPD